MQCLVMMTNFSNVKNRDTRHTIAHVYGVLIAMIMAMSQQTAQTKSHHQAYQLDTEIPTLTQDNVIDPHLEITIMLGTITMTFETGIGSAGPDPTHAVIYAGVTVVMTHAEVILGRITNPCTAAHHVTDVSAHTATDKIPHKADHHHAEVFP